MACHQGKTKKNNTEITLHTYENDQNPTLTTPIADKDNSHSHITAEDAMVSHFGRQLEFVTKLNTILTYGLQLPSSVLSKYKMCKFTYKKLHTNVSRSFIHNSQNRGVTKMYFRR